MTPGQCRAARALIDWSQPALALFARLGLSTVVDFELSRRKVSEEAIAAMQRALENSAIVFIDEPGLVGVGIRMAPHYATHEETLETFKASQNHSEG